MCLNSVFRFCLGSLICLVIATQTFASQDYVENLEKDNSVSLTHMVWNHNAFSVPFDWISGQALRQFFFGRNVFRQAWTVSPSSKQPFMGLGPLYSRSSCVSCHHQNGRGHPPLRKGEKIHSMVVKLGVRSPDSNKPSLPHPNYGRTLQYQGTGGTLSEGQTQITYISVKGNYADNSVYVLYEPSYSFQELNYGELGDKLQFSARIASPLIGLGLIASVDEEQLRDLADPDDTDGDGVSGRLALVEEQGSESDGIGRFGWKASHSSLIQFIAEALHEDMGITTTLHPTQPCWSQKNCTNNGNRSRIEASTVILDALAEYLSSLAPPKQRTMTDTSDTDGSMLFEKIGCPSCHVSTLRTSDQPKSKIPSNQEFHPYSDLLLHDMGPRLADGLELHHASGNEWRTAPLWGIGLTNIVSGQEHYLHDGRARTINEAILWHGGEALKSRQKYEELTSTERVRLVKYVKSL